MGHLLTPFNPKLGTGISVNLMAFCSLVWVGEGVVLDLGDWCSCQNVWGQIKGSICAACTDIRRELYNTVVNISLIFHCWVFNAILVDSTTTKLKWYYHFFDNEHSSLPLSSYSRWEVHASIVQIKAYGKFTAVFIEREGIA